MRSDMLPSKSLNGPRVESLAASDIIAVLR